jgi:hypothetical protein
MRRGATRLRDFLIPPAPDKGAQHETWIVPRFPWLLATAAGGALGPFLADLRQRLIGPLTYAGDWEPAIDAVVIGLCLGAAQWLVLRRRSPQASWWTAATIGGAVIGAYLTSMHGILDRSALTAMGASIGIAQSLVLPRGLEIRWWIVATTLGIALGFWADTTLPFSIPFVSGAFSGVSGALIGLGQWLVLRRRFARSGWWVTASAVGFWSGFALVDAVGRAVGGQFEGYAGGILGTAAGLAIYGMLTGAALVWLQSRDGCAGAEPLAQAAAASGGGPAKLAE